MPVGNFSGLTLYVLPPILHQGQRDRLMTKICINQRDTIEKNEQVQLMGAIYRQAEQVIAWLGKEDYECTFALESIQGMYDAQVFDHKGIRSAIAAVESSKREDDEQQKSFVRINSALDVLLDRFDFDAVVKAVSALISRSWWRRLWVIQELVLSRQAYLRCGPLAITWDSFEYFLDVCELFMLCNPTHPTFYPAYIIGYKSFILSKCWRQVQNGEQSTMFQLFEMMITIAIRETSDPRDRVYALLGLAKDSEQLRIRPDYSLSCAQVYMRTAEALIRKHGLIILSYCSFKRSRKLRSEGLPSWAPDLSGSVSDPLRGNATTSIYRASGSSEATLSFQSHGSLRLLKVHSIVVGKVAKKSHERPSPEASFDFSKAKILRKWLQKLPWYSPGEEVDDAIWRAPIANRINKRGQETSREAQSQDKAGFEALMARDTSLLTSTNDVVNDYVYSAWVRTVGRCLFTSSSGHIGLGSSEILPDDYIVILLGADIPFVVRNAGNDRCKIIGEVYLHAKMQGEATQRLRHAGPLYIE